MATSHWYDSELSQQILKQRYMHPGEKTPEEFMHRVASIMPSKRLREQVYRYLEAGFICPAGRTLYAAGAKSKFHASLSNCYIIPSPEDNLESIFQSTAEMARIFSYGGGVGVNISNLRPKDSKVNNAARTSTGAVSFLKLFDGVGEVISQNGRRGAMMVALDCTHPDLYEFLRIKQNNEKLASMNISILFHDDFMEAVKAKKPYKLSFKIEATGEVIEKTIDAAAFFDDYCKTQWDWGDPGALFIDKIRQHTLLSGYDEYKIEVTNPCGEFGGNAYNSCNLMSINMYNCISNKFTNNAYFDYTKLKKAVFVAVEALDNILDYGYDLQPLDQNRTCIDNWRSVGLGIMGFADALVALRIRYGSEESQKIAEKITKIMLLAALEQSMRLAAQKGPFKKFDVEKTLKSPLFKLVNAHKYCVPDPKTGLSNHTLLTLIKKYGLRNGTLLSIAPTGTISLLMGQFSGGCEPLYKISYQRTSHKMEDEGKSFKVYAHSVADLLEAKGIDPEKITDDEIKKRFPWIIESHDINPMERVKVQAALQKYVDNSISSTVNLRHEATPEEIKAIYMAAWENQCKGITVFRDGCKRGNLLGVAPKKKEEAKDEKVTVKTTSQDAKANKKVPATISYNSIVPIHRSSSMLKGQTIIKHTSCVDKMYITINQLENGDIFEIFTNVSGGCQSNIGTITRLASLALRSGVKVPEVIKQLVKVKCPACQALIRKGRKDISLSCGNAIGSALQEVYNQLKHQERPTISIPHKAHKEDLQDAVMFENKLNKHLEAISEGGCAHCSNADCPSANIKPQEHTKLVAQDITTGENSAINRQCPECGKYTLRPEGNCVTCSYCGWSKCE